MTHTLLKIQSESDNELLKDLLERNKDRRTGEKINMFPISFDYNIERNSLIFTKEENFRKICKLDQNDLSILHKIIKNNI